MTTDTDVAVIGSGFSAAALAINLVNRLAPTARVSLVGRKAKWGRGIAYSTRADCHLLNVTAARMSLFADQPDHFVQWLSQNGYAQAGDEFIPRQVYGRYIGSCLDTALEPSGNRAALHIVDAEVADAEITAEGGFRLMLTDGVTLSAGAAALCTGAGFRRLPIPEDAIAPGARQSIVDDPWQDEWWERLPKDADILLVGTGLTMIDQCLLLKARGFEGRLLAVSRRGLLPQPHLTPRKQPGDPVLSPGTGEVSGMLSRLRASARQEGDWRKVTDGLRPVTQALWTGLSASQRQRFLRHAAPYWNVHRHRMAPSVAAEIAELRNAGRLVVHRGRPASVRAVEGQIEVEIRGRANTTLCVDALVNCSGLERCTIDASPLLANLSKRGLVTADPLGLGIWVDDASACLPASEPKPPLYALGLLTAGRHWEITAVPDIRVQAAAVAAAIAGRIGRARPADEGAVRI
ncbi:uncharacterized NAD(P)/FAD-binding protein YdhS [Rhizobium subbaraonis]|uniref:Uncharacterized NAD(P)/FAD-binding protein YdhS n=1 Tax=Rhizobium subbaraonis TaxID=908946 RepID=A0A285UVW1_9HYPH|nr:FAD/NAD(P)-binding protein [Rhizobium subbaraonis]SOC45959.1 uncharacterized NAD(P)/FAD-binding protein YdhS [Rhizobium subbaraonis]